MNDKKLFKIGDEIFFIRKNSADWWSVKRGKVIEVEEQLLGKDVELLITKT